MDYAREEQLDIGKQIYNNETSKIDAAIKYSISEGTARDYMRLYRDVNGLPPKNRIWKEEKPAYSLGYLTPRQYRETYASVQ